MKPPSVLRGAGLVDALVGLAIGMLALLAIFHLYAQSETHKHAIVAASDTEQNATHALFLVARDAANAGAGIASAANDGSGHAVLDGCALLRPIPALVEAGARPQDPDAITLFHAGSATLATPVPLTANATVASLTTADAYVVPAPAGFSPNDVIAAVAGSACTLSAIAPGGVSVGADGLATLTHTPLGGALGVAYGAGSGHVVNLGHATALARIRYSVDTTTRALRAQQQLPSAGPVHPVVGDIVNLKAQYGLDTDGDGTVDSWQPATGSVWSASSLPAQPLAAVRQIQALRIAIVARSPQSETGVVTPGPLQLFDGTLAIPLSVAQQRFRYRVVETMVPLRNALWNAK